MCIVMYPPFKQYQPISVDYKNSNIDHLPVPRACSIQQSIPITDTQCNAILIPSANLGILNGNNQSENGSKNTLVLPNNNNNMNITDTNKYYSKPVDKIVLPPINTIIKENKSDTLEEGSPLIKVERKESINGVMPIDDIYANQKLLSTNDNVPKNMPTTVYPQTQQINLNSPLQQFPATISNTTVNNDNYNYEMNKFLPMQSNMTPYSVPNNIKGPMVSVPQFVTSNLPIPPQLNLQQPQQIITLEQNHQSQIYQPYPVYIPIQSPNSQIQQHGITVNNGYILGPPSYITPSLQPQYIPSKGTVTLVPMENYSVIKPNVFPNSLMVNVPESNSNKANENNIEKRNTEDKIMQNNKNTGVNSRGNNIISKGVTKSNNPLDNVPSLTAIQANLNMAKRLRKQCPVCGKICSRPSTLKTHYLIHSGDTPFKCTWEGCNKAFNVKSNMIRHFKAHQLKLQKEIEKK